VIKNHENEAVIPDQLDLDQYHSGVMTWEGFKVNYLAKLMKPEAEEWMKLVCAEAVNGNAVLLSDEEHDKNRYRVLLAEMMINMFSGQMDLRYMGELTESANSNIV
jgi:uncharacterized protein YeaO (DUF488 family)